MADGTFRYVRRPRSGWLGFDDPRGKRVYGLGAAHRGYGTYWNAEIVTVESRGNVVVRAVLLGLPGIPLWHWSASAAWDQEPRTDPTFLVWDARDDKDQNVLQVATKAWGAPESLFGLCSAGYIHIAVWRKGPH